MLKYVTLVPYIASQIGEKDRKAALGFLSQAGQLIDLTRSGKNRLEGQIMLALQYSALKSERGFAIMESIMPKLNELVAAAAVLNEFENNYLRDGEWNMTGEGAVGATSDHLGSQRRVLCENGF